jgi:hypothetical protein
MTQGASYGLDKILCPNETCPAKGWVGEGDITVHDKKKRRYRCKVCKRP